MSFNKDARDRIRRSTKRVEQAVTPQHRQRWRRNPPPVASGGGGFAIFKVSATIPARNGEWMGSVELPKYRVVDGALVDTGNTELVYNATEAAIEPYSGAPAGAPTGTECDPLARDGDLFVLAASVGGANIATTPLYPLSPLTVSTGASLTDVDLQVSRASILAISAECDHLSIGTTPCQ